MITWIKNIRLTKKRRRPKQPYIKSVAFDCAALHEDSLNHHREYINGIKFLFYIIAHNKKSYDVAKQWTLCMPFVKILMVPNTPFFESYVYKMYLNKKEIQIKDEWEKMDFIGVATYKSLKFLTTEKLKVKTKIKIPHLTLTLTLTLTCTCMIYEIILFPFPVLQ